MKENMKKYIVALSAAALLAGCLLMTSPAKASVCADGTGLPPFLSSGADPNLLLVIDNSGSMLDAAYVENVDECVDNAYDPAATYAGLFDPTKWYKWTEGSMPWVSGKTYNPGDYVYTEGIFYRAVVVSGPSIGAEIKDDYNVVWEKVYEIDYWANNRFYPAGSFVQFDDQLYYTNVGGTSNDPIASDDISIDDDIGVAWGKVDSTWLSSVTYNSDDVVSDNGMLFRATSSSSGSRPSEDIAGVNWLRLDEGYFEEMPFASINDAVAAVAAFPGDPYYNSDLGVMIYSPTGVESTVSAFAATGNLLNWASASKFDIQKKILTGGKYDANEEHLVSQSRGCSDHSFFKEVPVTHYITGVTEVLTLAVEGPSDEDWIDSTDFTTRISILGVSSGYADSARAAACATAIDEIAKGAAANQGQIKVKTTVCLDYGGVNNIMAESNSAYNHSMHECWAIAKKGYTLPSQLSVNEVAVSCGHIYDLDVNPSTISPDNSGYVCYGVYVPDPATGQDPNPDPDRPGYVGRCWEPSGIPAGCAPVPCVAGTPYNTGNPRCFPDDYLYDCSGSYNAIQDTCNKPWVLQLSDDTLTPLVAGTCPAAAVSSSPAQWTNDENPNSATQCIQQAVWDYCQGISMVEVIDPTDQIFNTGETWGLPGALVDSGVAAMLGTSRPLLVMKGYIKKAPDASGTVVPPEGVLHEVASDLRIGAMAFHHNGAATECLSATADDTIVQFCPDGNKDGARVIAPIQSGVAVTDDKGTADPSDDVSHVDDLAAAINAIQATAWTPLSEAIYNGLGYYGQNANHRLSADDFYTIYDGIAGWDDPVEYWCQQNHILVITEGASTTDLHQDVVNLVTTTMPGLGLEDSTLAAASESECLSASGARLLFGSTFLDDVVYYGAEAPVNHLYATPAANPGQLLDDPSQPFGGDNEWHDKQKVITHIVTTGVLRDDGTDSECNPATIMENAIANSGGSLLTGENPAQLEDNLRATLSSILSRVSAGSAASVISSSRSGSGAVYQAIFWPQQLDSSSNEVTWVGDVHGLFLDSDGQLWEDTPPGVGLPADRVLDTATDKRVKFFFDKLVALGTPERTRVCYVDLAYPEDLNSNGILDAGEDQNGNDELDVGCADPLEIAELDEVNYLWAAAAPNANGWLSDPTLDALTQRVGGFYVSDSLARHIFTWNDTDNDGIVDSGEQVDFTYNDLLALPAVSGGRGDLLYDFAVTGHDELERVVNWVRGQDQPAEDVNDNGVLDAGEDLNGNAVLDPAMRSRFFENKYWRLGDVIHSTPTLVGRPLESYHFVYQDPSYALFAKKYARRRNVVYFGANDGMLHAVNAGFFIEGESKFCLSSQSSCDAASETGQPPLGAELWAYIPYNLQPHLKCLTEPQYDHKYYVDQRPRIFDVQIFEDDNDVHPGGWGTILVGGMRFGGTPVDAASLNGNGADTRKFGSSIFVLDITDPENPPVLLGEMTMTTDNSFVDIGYTTATPSLVIMRDDDGATDWYLTFGNGPTTLKGENTEQGKLAVLPLEWLTGENTFVPQAAGPARLTFIDTGSKKPFRIPNAEPADPVGGGRFLIPPAAAGGVESFVSDLVSVDYDVNNPATPGIGAPYKTDAVYFGTVDGSGFGICGASKCWDGGGRMLRLVTREAAFDAAKNDKNSDGLHNSGETFTQSITKPWNWYLTTLLDAQGPVSTAPGIGWDGNNFWVYFGTGRFLDSDDKTDDQTQRFFGLKEPFACETGELSWDQIAWTPGVWPSAANAAAQRGLLRVDEFDVVEGTGDLYYQNSAFGTNTFENLRVFIVGERCPQVDLAIGVDGWYRDLPDLRERNLGQATLLGGLVTFSTYKPYADVCQAEGESFLYGVHYQTGTSWIKNLFGIDASGFVKSRISLGKGLALTPSLHVGTGDDAATAFVQTSTGEIIEIGQEELPLGNYKSGRSSWRQE